MPLANANEKASPARKSATQQTKNSLIAQANLPAAFSPFTMPPFPKSIIASHDNPFVDRKNCVAVPDHGGWIRAGAPPSPENRGQQNPLRPVRIRHLPVRFHIRLAGRSDSGSAARILVRTYLLSRPSGRADRAGENTGETASPVPHRSSSKRFLELRQLDHPARRLRLGR